MKMIPEMRVDEKKVRVRSEILTLYVQNETLAFCSILSIPSLSFARSYLLICMTDQLNVCVCTTCVSESACRGQKTVLDAVELFVSFHVGSGKLNPSFLKGQKVLLIADPYHIPFILSFKIPFLMLDFQAKSFSEECQHLCLLSVDVTEHHRQMVFIIK